MSGQELDTKVPAEIPNIVTGELVETSDTAAVARYLQDIREHEQQLKTLKSMLSELILERARQTGSKTLHFVGVDVRITGGPKIVWDVPKLRDLLEAGLPEERFNELVAETVDYKVNANVAKSIAAANETYAAIINAARGEEPAPERVSVSGS